MENPLEDLYKKIRFDLIGEFEDRIKVFEEKLQAYPVREQEEILTPTEASKFLKVTAPTLRKYAEKEYFYKYLIDGSPRYLKSEILSALKSGKIRGKGNSEFH